MNYKYFPHTEEDIQKMLQTVGVKKLEDLYDEVPESIKFKRDYNLPESKSEIEIRREFESLGKKNVPLICFAGAGVYDHYTPAVINYITQRSEFLTSYTPYQAEISQGTLEYIFEFQSLMASLTGMDISNASMYDGCTATAEAMRMAMASVKKADRVLISATLNPAVIRVTETYALFNEINLVTIPENNGTTDVDFLTKELEKGGVAGVIMGQPNYYGIIEDLTGIADLCHAHKALLILNCPAATLASLRSPGEWGADIAVGDAQSLGLPMNYGGPYLGYLCTKETLVRKMPGRIVGGTTDSNGQRTFVLTMQAREQHIRRQKATSNICTNQGIMTLFVTIYMALMGPKGLKEVNEQSYAGAHYLHDQLLKTNIFTDAFGIKPFFNEFCVRSKNDIGNIQQRLLENGILGGIRLCRNQMDDCLLLAVTEKRTKEEIDKFVSLIQEGEGK